jgi:hypothetical protein
VFQDKVLPCKSTQSKPSQEGVARQETKQMNPTSFSSLMSPEASVLANYRWAGVTDVGDHQADNDSGAQNKYSHERLPCCVTVKRRNSEVPSQNTKKTSKQTGHFLNFVYFSPTKSQKT